MNQVRNRVLREIFLAPSVVLPIVGGLSSLLLSWAADGVGWLTMAGLAGVLGGIGWMATRAIFKTESITAETIEKLRGQEIAAEEARLDQLDRLMSQDNDDRDQDLLRTLRVQRAQFHQISSQPGVVIRSQEILSQFEELYRASVNNLYESYRLLMQSKPLGVNERRILLDERERLLKEIQVSVDFSFSALEQYRSFTKKTVGTDLSSLREELDESIKIAKRTEERLRELDSSPDHPAYLRE
ncbi:MAG: hypothetical protein ACK5T6_08015 [Pirellula sp.]